MRLDAPAERRAPCNDDRNRKIPILTRLRQLESMVERKHLFSLPPTLEGRHYSGRCRSSRRGGDDSWLWLLRKDHLESLQQ